MELQHLSEPKRGAGAGVYGPVMVIYCMQALASVSAVLMLTGIYFYTHRLFGWGNRQNLLLATGLGISYVVGALSANAMGDQMGKRSAFRLVQLVLLLLIVAAFFFHGPIPLASVLILYSGVSGVEWPLLESMVSESAVGDALSKRLGVYNLFWSAANVLALAISGTIIQNFSSGIFVVAGVCTFVAMILVPRRESAPDPVAKTHVQPEVELLRVRTQALWLSRIALPSTYVVVCSLNAMMPSLPIMRSISTQWATLLGSVWFAARFGAFAVLGATTFWHTRPKTILIASTLMLIAFLGVTLRLSDMFPHLQLGPMNDLLAMILSQIVLGASMGIIYAASLYFGMVLSDGSTEHGGYHEALIGIGMGLGPASAYLADTVHPGEAGFGIAAVATLIGFSTLLALGAVVTSHHRRRAVLVNQT